MEDSRLKADRAGTRVREGHGPAPEGERIADGEPSGSRQAIVKNTVQDGSSDAGRESSVQNGSQAVGGDYTVPSGSLAAPFAGGRPADTADGFREERDLLGTMRIPAEELRGIHTFRALDNFQVSGKPTLPALIRAYILVKKACALANAETGWLDGVIADAICVAADEAVSALDRETGRDEGMGGAAGVLERTVAVIAGGKAGPARIAPKDFYLDALQGGAGTSTNMNVNEVLAARATEILRAAKGASGDGVRNTGAACGTGPNDARDICRNRLVDGPPSPLPRVDPLAHLNLHQSTNDTYPTALRVALIAKVRESAEAAALLQGAFQAKEREFAQVVTTGRTEMQAAVPMTLGAIFSGFAEAAGRDRWRTFKCEERLRVVNLGGTAVGTALTAPRKYIFRATEILRGLTGYPLARAENLVDATANADALAEVAGIISARAANLTKAARDLRQLAAFGDIALPAVQAGSSIMPGKVNPVILEAVIQAGMKARSECALACEAVGEGTLQINEFLPLVADSLLNAIDLATNASAALARHVAGIRANEAACAEAVNGNPIVATAFLPILGYTGVEALVKEWDAGNAGRETTADSFREWLSRRLGAELVDRALSPAALTALGHGEKPAALHGENI